MKSTIKVEGLACIYDKLKLVSASINNEIKVLVLESDPNPTYYSKNDFPPNKHLNAWHYYIPVRYNHHCFQDLVLRKASMIREKFNSTLNIYPGQLSLYNQTYQCIKIYATDHENLPNLVSEFSQMGVQFLSKKSLWPYTSYIYHKKYFELIAIEKDVYQDANNSSMYFFPIQKFLDFDEFVEGVERIKNKCKYNLFDSFLMYMQQKDSIIDFIGIYSDHCVKDRFGELKQELKSVFVK